MGGKSSPSPPNYSQAAKETAAGNLEAARAATSANRVDQETPYGSLTYSHKPVYNSDGTVNEDAGWKATQSLSPAEQEKLDKTNTLETGLLGTAQSGLGYVDKTLSTGGKLDESKLAQMPISGQSVQDAIMSRLQPQLDINTESLRTRLANQGLMDGSAAHKHSMEADGRNRNDLYIQAALQGIQTGLTGRQQGIQEQWAQQDRPLNIVNALRTGNQVNTPQFVNVPQQGQTNGPDLLGAAQAQYGADSGQANADNKNKSNMAIGVVTAAAMAF